MNGESPGYLPWDLQTTNIVTGVEKYKSMNRVAKFHALLEGVFSTPGGVSSIPGEEFSTPGEVFSSCGGKFSTPG